MAGQTGTQGGPGIIGRVDRISERLCFFFLALGGSLTVLMSLLTTYGVIRRYAFNNPEPYSYELVTMFFLFSFVFAVSYVDRGERHIRVDFISNLLPGRWRNILLNIFSPLLGLAYAFFLAREGWVAAVRSVTIGEVSLSVWAEPLWPIKLMIPLGYALLCLALLTRISRGITTLIITKEG
jgi:TRAP-type C4-dicarboxylate transport system permease small subunit